MPHYQGILFDLDGTLTDPQEGILNSIEYALQKLGIKVGPREELLSFIGPPLQESFQKYCGFDPGQAWQAVQYYREYFGEQGIFENKVYPGILDLLDKLAAQGRLLGVATSKPTVYAERILEHFQMKQYFQAVVGSNLDGTRVAKSEVIQEVLAGIPAIPQTAVVMVGDREHDIIGARANQIHSIGVTYGYGSETELKTAGANHLAGTVEELAKILLA